MAKNKEKDRFRGDVWFRENVHARVMESLELEEPRSQREHRKLLNLPIYQQEFQRQAKLFRQERREKRKQNMESRMEGEEERLLRVEQDMLWGKDHESDSDDALLDHVRRCAAELGKTPRMRDVPGGTYISQRFGSWALALTLAGLRLPRGVEPPSQKTINAYQKRIRAQKKRDNTE